MDAGAWNSDQKQERAEMKAAVGVQLCLLLLQIFVLLQSFCLYVWGLMTMTTPRTYIVNGGAHPSVSIGMAQPCPFHSQNYHCILLCMFTIMSSSLTLPPQLGFAKGDCPLLGN
jgi:hypothetical protein